MSIANLDIQETSIPQDESPADSPSESEQWYDQEYPYSTREHPYGYFPDKNGDPDFSRPRKRRPHSKSGANSVSRSMPSSEKSARTAAAVLTQMNSFVGMSLMAFGMPSTAQSLAQANREFEEMAFQALLTDPALCKKILSAGTTSGKAQLALAYAMLAGSIAPAALVEIKAKRSINDGEEYEDA